MFSHVISREYFYPLTICASIPYCNMSIYPAEYTVKQTRTVNFFLSEETDSFQCERHFHGKNGQENAYQSITKIFISYFVQPQRMVTHGYFREK